MTPIRLERNISKTTWAIETSNLVCSFVSGLPSGRTNNFPESGRGLGHVTPTIFGSTDGYPSDSLASCCLGLSVHCIAFLGIISSYIVILVRCIYRLSADRAPTSGPIRWHWQCATFMSSLIFVTSLYQRKTRKPSYRWLNRATRKPAKNCSNSTCLQRCRWQYWPIFIRLAVVAFEICEIPRN